MNITNRTTHDVQQGTGDWLRLRQDYATASEAPAALGVSRYVSRETLLRRKHTGIADEPDAATLGRFRAGHEAEALARPLAEQIVGGDLYPVTMTADVDGWGLLASLDGLTLDGSTAWETKLWNEELASAVRAGTLPEHYKVQMDQCLLVSGADRCLFTCTDGTPERMVWCWYTPTPERFSALLDGWIQFERDLAKYKLPEAAEPAPVGRAPETLPALRIELRGEVSASNLAEFRETAIGAIRGVNRTLKTDQDFADAERAVKWCADVEARLKAAKEHALSQTASIDALFKALDDISDEARKVRLDLSKLVDRRKVEVKEEAIAHHREMLEDHIAVVHAEISPMRLLTTQTVADWAGAIKGLKSMASIEERLGVTLAGAKIASDAAARQVRVNAEAFRTIAAGFETLFPDLGQLVHKAPDDFSAALQARIAQHQAAEAQKRAQEQAQAAPPASITPAPVPPGWNAPPQQTYAHQPQQPLMPVHNQHAAADDEPATLKLGTVCERLGFTMTAAFVGDTLGVKPARTDGRSVLYTEEQFTVICVRLQHHISKVCQAVPA